MFSEFFLRSHKISNKLLSADMQDRSLRGNPAKVSKKDLRRLFLTLKTMKVRTYKTAL